MAERFPRFVTDKEQAHEMAKRFDVLHEVQLPYLRMAENVRNAAKDKRLKPTDNPEGIEKTLNAIGLVNVVNKEAQMRLGEDAQEIKLDEVIKPEHRYIRFAVDAIASELKNKTITSDSDTHVYGGGVNVLSPHIAYIPLSERKLSLALPKDNLFVDHPIASNHPAVYRRLRIISAIAGADQWGEQTAVFDGAGHHTEIWKWKTNMGLELNQQRTNKDVVMTVKKASK